MSEQLAQLEKKGGGSLSLVEGFILLRNQQTKNIIINATKKYIVFASCCYPSGGADYRQAVYQVSSNQVIMLYDGGAHYSNVTVNGTTLTLITTDTQGIYSSFSVFEME